MPEANLRCGSLVLYKNRPALVRQVGKKLEIELGEGERVRVRPKDVDILHPGPLESLDELIPQDGEVQAAWELLAGGSTALAELAELAYGDFTPATAWAAWQVVDDGLYFHGSPAAIVARTAPEMLREQAMREARIAQEQAWNAFLARAARGQIVAEDATYLRDVEDLALGRTDRSRVLRELGRSQTAENAHAFLLKLGFWDYTVNPYPHRLHVISTSAAAELTPLPQEDRLDLTSLPAFAIDDEGNQDPDDAISQDGDRLWVHIADVAALVTPDSPADLEARARGANLYLPEGTISMLPTQATEQLGLGLAEVSPALSFGLDLGDQGEVVGIEIAPSWVRVTRLTYEEAEARLNQEPLAWLYGLAQRRLARRQAHGAVSIDLPEVRIRVVDGQVDIRPLPPLRSRELVTEAMLAAGEAAARFALQHGIPLPFTIQEPPELPADNLPPGLAGMFALRRTLKPSQQSSVPAAHSGLGLPLYARATSPLRRYLDLVVHQQLRAYLRGQELMDVQAVLERVGAAEVVTGSLAQAERLSRRHWTLVYLMQHPDWQGEGVLVELRGRRGTVLIPELDWEARVNLRRELPLNSTVPLTLQGTNLAQLEAYFQVAGP